MKHLQITVSSFSATDWSPQNLVSVLSFGVNVRTPQVMLFCNSSGLCFAWLVKLTVVALYTIFPYFWCSTVDSIQFHVACCTPVSFRWRYITDISLVHLLPWNGPKCLPANTQNMSVMRGCVVCPAFTVHCAPSFRDKMDYIILSCIIMCFLILVPIILPFPVDINHVKYYINIVELNTNYVFLSEYSNWTADSTCWRESVHVWHV